MSPILMHDDALDFFATLYRGKHHLPSAMRDEGNGCWSVSHYGDLASFDYDDLTRLVLLAHDRCVRVWVRAGQPRHVRIWIAARYRGTGSMTSDHPTIEDAILKFRERDDTGWPRVFAEREAKEKTA